MEGLANAIRLVNEEIKKFEQPMEIGDQQTFLFSDGVIVFELDIDENDRRVARTQVLMGEPIRIDAVIGL